VREIEIVNAYRNTIKIIINDSKVDVILIKSYTCNINIAIVENTTTFSVKMSFMTVTMSGTLNLYLIAIFALIDVQLMYVQGHKCFVSKVAYISRHIFVV